ncbi:hypothetical protein BKA66DRAFT_564794 [Pyrenochaeta sp. MPI-SDFR-AT-0127]|nr:hypothetical protein BKA66DRAFT_564794 [Pyrenochaeta sp. MPI-SDFR-AT-0127]
MSTTSSTSLSFRWGPPDPTVLSFNDCGRATNYYKVKLPRGDIPYDATADFLMNGISYYLQQKQLDPPLKRELVDWCSKTPQVRQIMRNYTLTNCLSKLCPEMRWQGNSDITGVGMLTTYVVQALLVTLYLTVLLSDRGELLPKRYRKLPYVEKCIMSITHSTTTFLNASFVFCAAMLFATVISFIRVIAVGTQKVRQQPMSTSAYVVSMMISLQSVLPVALLNMASSNLLRRAKGRRLLWALVTVLVTVVLVLGIYVNWYVTLLRYDQKYLSSRRYYDDQLDWENTCADFDPMRHIRDFATGLGALLFVALVVYTVSPFMLLPKRLRKHFWYKTTVRIMQWQGLILGFVTMWFCIGWLIRFRIQLDVNGGISNKDLELSFGQILALATWVPVLVEITYIYWERPTEALTGRLIRPFKVIMGP